MLDQAPQPPNLLPRAGKAGPEEIGAGNGREERGRETAARSRRSCMRAGGSPASRAFCDDCGIAYSSRLHAAMPMFMHPDCACPSEGVREGRLVRKNNAPWQSGAHICQVVARRMCIVSLLYMGVRGSLCNACRCWRYAVAITLPQGVRIAWPPFESFHMGMFLHRLPARARWVGWVGLWRWERFALRGARLVVESCLTRAWRNWQTRTVQVRMRAIS